MSATPIRAYPKNRERSPSGERARTIYVAAVSTSRHFGGREEGGWYYDISEVLECRRTVCPMRARAIARELRDEYPTCPYGRGSAIGGDDMDVFLSYDAAAVDALNHNGFQPYE